MGMTGTIEINELRIFARHGAQEQEHVVGNIFEVTVHISYPLEEAMKRDNLSSTVNYSRVVEVIKQVMLVPSILVENVVYRLYETLKWNFPHITGGMIRIAKITPPIAAELSSVAVKLEW